MAAVRLSMPALVGPAAASALRAFGAVARALAWVSRVGEGSKACCLGGLVAGEGSKTCSIGFLTAQVGVGNVLYRLLDSAGGGRRRVL